MVALVIGVGIPVVLLGIYFVGSLAYGERWYLAFGKNSTWGGDDSVAQELEELRFTRLHLNDPGPVIEGTPTSAEASELVQSRPAGSPSDQS